jgi:hypothetical protein
MYILVLILISHKLFTNNQQVPPPLPMHGTMTRLGACLDRLFSEEFFKKSSSGEKLSLEKSWLVRI